MSSSIAVFEAAIR